MKKQRWIDLSQHGVYLGSIKMADGVERLTLIDMNNAIAPHKLRDTGFLPFEGSPRFDKGIYYLAGDQALRPSSIAAALGIAKCPVIEVAVSEIESVFRAKCLEMFQANLNAVTLRSAVLGRNNDGKYVYQTPAGRFVRTSKSEVIVERSPEGAALSKATFLRAGDDRELRECADGFLGAILDGGKAAWPDLVKFGKVVFDRDATDGEMHRLQEAVEASAYAAFAARASIPDKQALGIASDLYFGLPVARMRTAESVFLQQYSTPLPMAVVAQRLLLGNDDATGKSALEPTGGNGGLLGLMPESIKLYALELDRKRVEVLQSNPRIHAELGDATTVPFRARFGEPDGFDYTIANPPFGQLDSPQAFDKIPSVRRIDHLIALRTLQARKDGGRSVLIMGADSPHSDGTIKGGAKSFLNYLHDHYEVHGCVEVDGRLYARNGAGYNVRMVVIGAKLPQPRTVSVPEKLTILTSYDDLWNWSEHVIEAYSAPRPVAEIVEIVEVAEVVAPVSPVVVGQRVRFTADDTGHPLSVGIVEGVIIALDKTTTGAFRYRLDTGMPSPQGGGTMEKIVYTNAGKVELLPEPPLPGLDALQVAITDTQPFDDLPEGAVVFNAPRPLLGTRAHEGDFLNGRYYNLVTPDDSMAVRFMEENRKLAASVVLVASRDEQVAMALLTVSDKYRDRYFTEMTAEERYGALSGKIRNLNDLMYGQARLMLESARALIAARPVVEVEADAEVDPVDVPVETIADPVADPVVVETIAIDAAAITTAVEPAFTTSANPPSVTVAGAGAGAGADASGSAGVKAEAEAEQPAPQQSASQKAAPQRHVNEFQTPYQPASKLGMPSGMIPINMAGATYAALNDLEAEHGSVDDYVAKKLQYTTAQLGQYFSAEQVDALALAIRSNEAGRGIINADQTGMGKGRFVAGMMRYAKLHDQVPVFLTIKPELFTDIFRDIDDIGSRDIFKNLFMFNDGVHVMRYGTESDILYRATTPQDRRKALEDMAIDPATDMVLGTYSQFQRAASKNLKSQLLTAISQQNVMLFLDESHVASGASNISAAVGEAVANSKGVIYSSATPLKGVTNFSIYNKVFPASVDLKSLPDTLRGGGEALQEAISANMARDGVIIRREHDFSKLTFVTRLPEQERQQRNINAANKLSQILAAMSYLAGDVGKMINKLNKEYEKDWSKIPEAERKGGRMRASSMNFGSRLHSLNRQFLLGIKIEEAVAACLEALQEGRKPVIAVENTGESLLRQVLSRRAGVDELEKQLEELDERDGSLTDEEKVRRDELQTRIGQALRDVRLETPPQYRELLEVMLDRIGEIKVQGRYGDVKTEYPESEEYELAEQKLRALIQDFPDLPLMPLDVIKHELETRNFPISEVSGRTASLSMVDGKWAPQFHPKSDAVANVAGFQNGKYDAIIITRSGSTGISLHATDRFADSDIRQRDFIVLQKAANIAEFLQWLGRVNRKDQVCDPVITTLDSGLPAELRLTMMHNAKLRKLSANTTSNRENGNAEGDDLDLLNDVGDSVALEWLFENPDVAERLDISLPKDDDEDFSRFSQDCPYVNKLLGRLMMVEVSRQQEILDTLGRRFADRIEELEQRGENPFKVDVYEWGASVVKEEELQSGVLEPTGSTFDNAVKIVTVEFEQDVKPIRGAELVEAITAGMRAYKLDGPLDENGSISTFASRLGSLSDDALRKQLPGKLRDSEQSLAAIMNANELPQLVKAKEKQQFLFNNLAYFKPGACLSYADLLKGDLQGIVTQVYFPATPDDAFLLSKYSMKVVFPGDDKPKDISLATLFNQGQSLVSHSHRAIDPERMEKYAFVRSAVEITLKPFNDVEDGKVKRRAHVLQGNIFRACELARQQSLGSPILFSDAEGNRQRAVLLKEKITPEKVKALPIAMDAKDIVAYAEEFLRPDHIDHRSRAMFGGLRVYDASVKDMKKGDGIMLEVLNGGRDFRLTMPGTKSRAGRLMTDGFIFEVGEKTDPDSLRLKLSGTKAFMSVDVRREQLPDLLRRMQIGGHVGKFYLPEPDHATIKSLKARYEAERAADNCATEMNRAA